jgi:hypothetical protein
VPGNPALLVPLPTAAADHQTANARALAEAGGAMDTGIAGDGQTDRRRDSIVAGG